MWKLLVLTGAVCLVSACSSKNLTMTERGLPYCYSDENHVTKNGKTDSTIVTECSDRPGQQLAIQRAGIDKTCKEFWYDEYRNGRRYQQRGVRCEKLDGTWEILNINGTVN